MANVMKRRLVDAQRLARTLGLRRGDLAHAARISAATVSRGARSQRSQEALREIRDLFDRTTELFGGNSRHAKIWLHAPNPELGFKAPIQYLIEGRLTVLKAFLDDVGPV